MAAYTDFDRAVFEAARDIILIAPLTAKGGPGKFLRANPYACERLGYTLEQFQDLTPFDISEDRPPTLLDDLRHQGVVRGEMTFVASTGHRFPGDFIIRIIKIEGRPYLLAIVRDISKLVAARKASERLVRELSTPILRVSADVLAMPVVGEITSERAELMTQRLLDAIASQGPRRFVLDLTGVELVDTATANYLGNMMRAAQLLGTECVIAGISAPLAMSLSQLDALPSTVKVFATLADALHQA